MQQMLIQSIHRMTPMDTINRLCRLKGRLVQCWQSSVGHTPLQRNASGGHLVFQNEANFSPREAYLPMKISCKFGEPSSVFALERDFASLYTLWASCRKTNSPTHLCCRYQAKHSKLTEEIRLLSEATTYIFPH